MHYCQEIDDFVAKNKDLGLRTYELSSPEWSVITVVTNWLLLFRKAMVAMSATKVPMLSSTHATLKGLQDRLREELTKLPSSALPLLRKALTEAHTKLGEYFFKIDISPYVIWTSCKFN